MRSNASIFAAFLLLAGCGGGAWSDVALEPGLSPAAQAMPAYSQPAPQVATEPAYERPGALYEAPGTDDPAAGASGPSGSSRPAAGEARYDEVGYAEVGSVEGGGADMVAAAHPSLAPGGYVEVTSLDTGKTILLLIAGQSAGGNVLNLSPAAAQLLGATTSPIPVRVRRATASPPDQAALRAGRPAAERGDTPPVLLTALRKALAAKGPAYRAPAPAHARPAPRAAGGSLYVQVAALSNAGNAQALAQELGGFVRSGGGFHRVQLGPFRTPGEAQAARADAVRRGFPDARVFTQP